MIGMDRTTGKTLAGIDHLRQSIADILTTPIGSRVMRRDYGSALFELIDQPMNGLGLLRLYAATADAIRRWEPRIRLTRIAVAGGEAVALSAGVFALDLEGEVAGLSGANGLTQLSIPLRPANA